MNEEKLMIEKEGNNDMKRKEDEGGWQKSCERQANHYYH
jgi:hypothetical protein